MNNKIEDFGAKIGGARKDLWKGRGLSWEDAYDMTPAEREKYVTKENIWPLPDAKKQVEEGMPPFVAYFIRRMRRIADPKPKYSPLASPIEVFEDYVTQISSFKAKIEAITTIEEMETFLDECYNASYKEWEYRDAVDLYGIKKFAWNKNYYFYKMQSENFPYGRAKQKRQRKTAFVPPQLTHIVRDGENYLGGFNATPEKWQSTFNFRGVEFGNWNSQNDRQQNLNMCYLALKDLAVTLGIDDKSITFNGSLALGFGSRGIKNALAHYEPLLQVINLTKLRGAGSLAHEWGHALDHQIALMNGYETSKLASEMNRTFHASFQNVLYLLKHKANGDYSDFYEASKAFDAKYSKDSHGYWSSSCEMFARAFACYVHDKCPCRSDYLFGHSESCAPAIPMGTERENINQAFDELFEDLIRLGFLEKRKEEPKPKPEKKLVNNPVATVTFPVMEDLTGQLSFNLG